MTTREKMFNRSISVRGRIIQHAIEIETRFEDYIAKHLTSDLNKEFDLTTLLLAPYISFEAKFQVFQYFVEKHNPEFGRKAPKYKTQLPEIIMYRNHFAHFPIVITEETEKEFEKDGSLSF